MVKNQYPPDSQNPLVPKMTQQNSQAHVLTPTFTQQQRLYEIDGQFAKLIKFPISIDDSDLSARFIGTKSEIQTKFMEYAIQN